MPRGLVMGGDGFGFFNVGIPAATLPAVAAELRSIVDALVVAGDYVQLHFC